jgi:hypothetical protein
MLVYTMITVFNRTDLQACNNIDSLNAMVPRCHHSLTKIPDLSAFTFPLFAPCFNSSPLRSHVSRLKSQISRLKSHIK